MDWYYNKGEEVIGSVSEEDILNLIKENIISRDTLLWNEEMEDWKVITEITDFKKVLPQRQPPPLPKIKIPKNKVELLPSTIKCQFCEFKWDLSAEERKKNRFQCHSCKRIILTVRDDGIDIVTPKSSSLPINQNKDQEGFVETDKNMKWFKFYTYFLIPLGILQGILSLFIYFFDIPSSGVPNPLVSIFIMGILVILFIGLKTRKLWGLYLNYFYLGVFSLFYPFIIYIIIDRDEFLFVSLLGITILYLLGNLYYFNERKRLFS